MELKTTTKTLQQQHEKAMVEINERFVKDTDRMNQLEQMINQEREDRLRQTDENLRPIRQQLARTLIVTSYSTLS